MSSLLSLPQRFFILFFCVVEGSSYYILVRVTECPKVNSCFAICRYFCVLHFMKDFILLYTSFSQLIPQCPLEFLQR